MSLGLKPNVKSYSLLVDAHLINRDVKSALAVIDDMVTGFFFLERTVSLFFQQRSLTYIKFIGRGLLDLNRRKRH